VYQPNLDMEFVSVYWQIETVYRYFNFSCKLLHTLLKQFEAQHLKLVSNYTKLNGAWHYTLDEMMFMKKYALRIEDC